MSNLLLKDTSLPKGFCPCYYCTPRKQIDLDALRANSFSAANFTAPLPRICEVIQTRKPYLLNKVEDSLVRHLDYSGAQAIVDSFEHLDESSQLWLKEHQLCAFCGIALTDMGVLVIPMIVPSGQSISLLWSPYNREEGFDESTLVAFLGSSH